MNLGKNLLSAACRLSSADWFAQHVIGGYHLFDLVPDVTRRTPIDPHDVRQHRDRIEEDADRAAHPETTANSVQSPESSPQRRTIPFRLSTQFSSNVPSW